MTRSLFAPERDAWRPTDFSRGPWSPEALHGGPVAALLARAVEQVPADLPMQAARMTVELLRPVGLAPVSLEADLVRPGRKVQLVGVTATQDGQEVARAVLLRLRTEDVPVPEGLPDAVPPPPSEGGNDASWAADDQIAFHNSGVEHAFVLGHFSRPGPATDWIRLQVPVVPDEEPSPLQRVMAAADFGNGISRALDPTRTTFVNPDLTVYLHRLPDGEWVCLEATTYFGTNGIAVAESALYDEHGRIGRAVQSLLLDQIS